MKKLIYITGAALVMLASASCEKKETVKEAQPSVEKTEMVFTATSGSGALKTTIKSDGTTAVWSATDNLKVFTAEDQTGSVCNYKSGAGKTTAEFEGQCAKKGPWTAICPASSAKSFSDGTITFTMPETQTYAENTFAAGAMPCVAYSETNTFNFNHSFGVLKLSLKLKSGTSGSVKSITVTTKGSEKLNGTFTVNPQNSAVATYSTGGTSSVTLNCTSVALNASTATDFWIVVPEGAFASGFDVTVTSTNDVETALSTTKANTITAGEVNKMPVQTIEFPIGRGTAKRTGDIDVKWIQLWKDGPKWAEYNVGATSVRECGCHYCWGGTIDNDPYYQWCERAGSDIQGGEFDTARNLWGDNWQMPTKANFQDLIKNCIVTEYYGDNKYEGLNGILFTGKEIYSGNSVFFPAAGYYIDYYELHSEIGNYWSSKTISETRTNTLFFYSGSTPQVYTYNNVRNEVSVRAILKE